MLLLASFFVLQPASAQHHLLGGDAHLGGFAGPVLKLSAVDGTTAAFFGGRGGMTLATGPGQHLGIGGGMYGMMSGVEEAAPTPAGQARHLRFGYGGLELEYLLRPNDVLYLSVVTLLGAGQAGFDDDRAGSHGFGHMWGGGAAFFVAEPGVNLILNVTPFLRLGLGGSSRFAGSTPSEELRGVDLSEWSGQLAVQLGRLRRW